MIQIMLEFYGFHQIVIHNIQCKTQYSLLQRYCQLINHFSILLLLYNQSFILHSLTVVPYVINAM